MEAVIAMHRGANAYGVLMQGSEFILDNPEFQRQVAEAVLNAAANL